ncbi:helix-turn-helix domain-containing protein [Exiguobacterium alkaliphilum]|uniref:Helix-turn-helix domain-containing protein n=1 Tax=Exiguobacterium alkaliphilum TaxID=1428684 RepID=A0ABT2KZV1_9BACL|nr:helix-turn-helix domain-containing protein [Exiguobacterium alkaliphilum]MCT4796011.1 helix-turn-helix domain-containing protein [Exiguobacterium alkaliphilum]
MKEIQEIGKLLFDEKTFQILEHTKQEPRNTKEIAKLMKQPTANLYYPIKKLIEIDALRIERQEQVKNILENYYSSRHLYTDDKLAIEGDFLTSNLNHVLQWYFVQVHQTAQALKRDVIEQDEGTAEIGYATKTLTHAQWKELNRQIRHVIHNYEPEASSDEATDYQFLISSHKTNA